mmetsp:Transcript_13219/g.23377  ORF Transcript_13219/g.23377 Transcript_13219/m.23377 type:complete len:226 (-) Transcript_13219:903-1580(-)
MDLPVVFLLLEGGIEALVPIAVHLKLCIFPFCALQSPISLLRSSLLQGLLLDAHCPLLHLFASLSLLLPAGIGRDTQQLKAVSQNLFFHNTVKLGFCSKGGRVIDLQEPRLKLVIQHDVEAQYLKAHAIVHIIWLATTIEVRQARLNCNQGLDDQVLDLHVQRVDVVPFTFQMLLHCLPTPFVTILGVVWIRVFLEIWIHLVDGVIGEMHHHRLQIFTCWLNVGL